MLSKSTANLLTLTLTVNQINLTINLTLMGITLKGKAEIKAPDLSDSDLSGCQVRLTATAEIKSPRR